MSFVGFSDITNNKITEYYRGYLLNCQYMYRIQIVKYKHQHLQSLWRSSCTEKR